MAFIKRFTAFFTALAILLTLLSGGKAAVYAAETTAASPWVMDDKTVNSDDTINYTQGIYVGYSNTVTFRNDGTVNITGGSFETFSSFVFENNGTFNFTGSNATFSLGSSSASFINNGTATIKGVYNFSAQSGTSFVNNGTLFLEDVSNLNLDGFVNNGIIVIPDDAKNQYLHLALETKNGENGQVYTKTEFESKGVIYSISYEGLSCDGYSDYTNSGNPADYEYAAANPQDVTLADPVLPGYEFLGWTGLDITSPTKNLTFSSSVQTDMTFTAHWRKEVYNITYDTDGGNFNVYDNVNYTYSRGDTPKLSWVYKAGYTFLGWVDSDDPDEKLLGSATEYYYLPPAALGDKSFKAKYIANSDTRYNINCYYENLDGTYDEKIYISAGTTDEQASVSSDGYLKEGFCFDSENPKNIVSGTVASDNSLTLKLYFKRNKYTVTYKSQDGSGILWTTERKYGENVGDYGGEIPVRASDNTLYSYNFAGWARYENLDFGFEAIKTFPVTEDLCFYAAFEEIRDESAVVIRWETYEGFNAPAQTEIILDKGADYTVQLELENEKYYIGTPQWSLGFKEAHVYWRENATGEHEVEYSVSKEGFDDPVTLLIPNVQHDIYIMLKANYHEEHDFSEEYDTIIENGGCVKDSVIRHFCYKCGKTSDETIVAGGHKTGGSFEKDEISHWKVCGICGDKLEETTHTPDGGVVTHEPTHHSTGTKTYTCTVCGYVTKLEFLPIIPHTAEGDWQSNGINHYKLCSCGEKLEISAHISDNGTVTSEPTYDTEGKIEYRCTVCDYLLGTESIAPLSHNPDSEWQSNVTGHWHNCDCGEKHSFGGHISDGGVYTTEPTYDTWGERVYSCTICGYVLSTETLPPLSHKTDGEWAYNETHHWIDDCGCGEKHGLSVHVSDNGTVTAYPTETENGSKEYRCTVCGYIIKTEDIPALGEDDEPSEPSEPSDPIIPSEPSNPPESSAPSEPSDPTESNAPSESSVTTEPSCPLEQENTNKQDSAETGVPFIKGKNEKKGWEIIYSEAETAGDGDIINVDMNTASVVPGYIFDAIKGKDVTVTFDMGGGVVWSVSGKSITADKAVSIDFTVTKNTMTIPADIVNNLTGKRYSLSLSLAHSGMLGFTAVLSINLGSDNAGLRAVLYYFNGEALEAVGEDKISDDGTAEFNFTHASDYLIVIDGETNSAVGENNPETGEAGKPWGLTLIISMAVIVGAHLFKGRKNEI